MSFSPIEKIESLYKKISRFDLLNSIIPMIMQIVRKWNGEIEKNTGDGIMAIFGTETRNSFLMARDAIESAMVMRYVMLNDIHPKLNEDSAPLLNFRIGIDMGEVLISRIGSRILIS